MQKTMAQNRRMVAGNWKMNTTLSSGQELAQALADQMPESDIPVVIGVPFPFLAAMAAIIQQRDNFFLAAQNCHQAEKGAYTGEVSTAMLSSVGCQYVILGHSERRDYFEESDELINAKVKKVIADDMLPIFCCGEKLEVREADNHQELVAQQLDGGLFNLEPADFQKVVIAYEPVWAIGTGVTASPEQAQEMHAYIRRLVEDKYGAEIAVNATILYGGSVKPGNANDLFAQEDVDGGLVGGASLKANDFIEIIKAIQ